MNIFSEKPLGILYEHPRWFNPLFQELENRNIPFTKVGPIFNRFNPAESDLPYRLLYNDMSLSWYLNEQHKSVLGRIEYIAQLEKRGVQVINGSNTVTIGNSKAKQLSLLNSFGLPFPQTRIIDHIDQLLPAADELKFPLIIKSNFGERGRVRLFQTLRELKEALINEQLDFGIDNLLMVQEFIPAKGKHFVRVETLNGKFMYALKIYVNGEGLDVWPLEVKFEAFTPPVDIVRSVENIVRAAGIEVGSVEYFTDRRSNKTYFFDVNAHANYTLEVRNALGYDPFTQLAGYLERRLWKIKEIALAI